MGCLFLYAEGGRSVWMVYTLGMTDPVPNAADVATILVVEDETSLREALSLTLTHEGFKVLTAENGTQGLKIALDAKPDLLLLDIRMPEMTGFQMLTRLRDSGGWGLHVPAVFLTNISMSDDDEKADVANLEPKMYIVKSDTSMQDIVAKVKTILQK